jgi:hypothetical protein
MKKNIMNTKYIWLLVILIGFSACNEIDDVLENQNIDTTVEVLPNLNAGSADFSNYVSLGNSLTAGYTDGALFIASQGNSLPNTLAQQFALVGGGSFNQPLTSDNFGGLAAGGNRIADPRLVFGGAGPVPLESLIGTVTVSTDIVLNNPSGPFNNMGVPGAKAAHLLYDGYGNMANLGVSANPYFIRMASSSTATVLGDAMAQSPTFFSLWIGNNDVLGYALSGGDGTNPITPSAGAPGVGFDQTYGALIATLTSGGTKGIVANIPYVTTIPHFTTVPYNPIPLNAATAGALNQGYAAYNGGLQQALAALNGTGLFTAEEVAKRTITFSEGEGNALVIIDENLTDLGAINPAFSGIPQFRQATEDDLFVLPLASLIPQGYGTQIQLADKWVLTPEEQDEIKIATDAFNATIKAMAASAGLAFVDANSFMQQLHTGGYSDGNFTLTSSLVTGGAFSLDGVHPTARGYALLANLFMKAIDATYESNFEASGNLVDIGNYPTNYSPLLQ